MFEGFDFELINSPEFKEDSVREELIHPILKALGYSASPPNQITRSPSLLHPYVYIGSKRHRIHIIPDYLLKRDGQNFFILDAKAPSEEILRGKNVEQAYSYAIHKDVRTELFALCNGREFALFHISHWPELLSVPVADIEQAWPLLVSHIGTSAVRRKVAYYPDLGIGMMLLGFGVDKKRRKIAHLFTMVEAHLVARVNNDIFSIQSHFHFNGTTFLGTFDFRVEQLEEFLTCLQPASIRPEIRRALTNNPFTWQTDNGAFAIIGISCVLSDHIESNEAEEYIPFTVRDFI